MVGPLHDWRLFVSTWASISSGRPPLFFGRRHGHQAPTKKLPMRPNFRPPERVDSASLASGATGWPMRDEPHAFVSSGMNLAEFLFTGKLRSHSLWGPEQRNQVSACGFWLRLASLLRLYGSQIGKSAIGVYPNVSTTAKHSQICLGTMED